VIGDKMEMRRVVGRKKIYVVRLFTIMMRFLNYPKIYKFKLCEVNIVKVELI
jgi:hypothetical protein